MEVWIERNPYISPSNIKLAGIPSFSTPPIETCPGRTAACSGCDGCRPAPADSAPAPKGYCYIMKMIAARPSIGISYNRNLDAVLQGNFIVPAARWISKHSPSEFRFGVGGDFFSRSYIQQTRQLVTMFPNVRFMAFTRSWRIPRLRRELETLRALPNFVLIASQDSETEPAPAGWRRAYAGKPARPARGRRLIMCPGYGPQALTCKQCLLCFRPSNVDIYFPIH